MEKLSLQYKLIYSMGNLGIALITVMHTSFLVYYFFPPADSGIPYVIPQSDLILGITVLGAIMTLGRIVDAILDPIIASFSDRLQHPAGRRVPMMRWAALPFVICYLLTFFVPVGGDISYLNAMWMLVFLVASALFFTCYMIPFYSLMVELAKSSDDKVDLGTISSAFWFVGFLLVSFTPGLWSEVAEIFGTTRVWGLKITFMGFGVLGFICLMIPALLIDETAFADGRVKSSHQKLFPALKRVLRNRSFAFYLGANTCYTVATAMFEAGLIYYVTVLAVMEAGMNGPLTTVVGALTLACYPLIAKTAKSLGKAWVLKVSLLLFAGTFVVITFLGIGGISPYILFGLVVVLSPFAQAGFGILPQVVASDCAAYDQYKTGEDHAGMYIAANGFFRKVGGTLGVLFFTSFLIMGKDVGDDMGIRLATALGALVCVVGFLLMRYYNENEILSYNRALVEEGTAAAASETTA
ncbi:MFS transporter [Halioglobus maricola]|uniref:MFS transporter n=1 Tax=Halioglobus maricola TaxID=2601894 RepID=A0A5P9NJP3_9GAMM|nr:MFS transporter [Halioglobus maricola]QFU75444.1 MFS transporter [Halioglobus maricola]